MKASLKYRLLYAYARFGFRLFYNVRINGEDKIPHGKPVIFAANHQNALMDALAILFAAGKPVHFLARADIFKNPFIARILRFLKIMPVFRPRDGVDILDKNSEVFEKVAQMLTSGESIGIMPEGTHTHIKHLQLLKKGICRMAFEAAEFTGFKLDTQIVPIGLDYSDYHTQGSRLLINFGDPIPIFEYYELYKTMPNKAVTQLRDRLADSIRGLMIDVKHPDEFDFIMRYAEWTTQSSQSEMQEDPFTHFYRLRETVEYLNELKLNDSARYDLLKAEHAFLTGNQSSGLLPIRPPRQKKGLIRLIIGSLISGAGVVLNCVPLYLSFYYSEKVKDRQFVSSVKYVIALVLFPIWYLIVFVIATLTGGILYGVGIVFLMMVLGVYAFKNPLK